MLNKVTLYQTTKSEHLTLANHLELNQYNYDDVIHIRGSDEFIPKQEVKHINIPIQKYVFSQRDWKGNVEERVVYAAFDYQLLEIIQCERSKFQDLNDEIVCKVAQIQDLKGENNVLQQRHSRIENECLQLKTKLSKIEQMSWWKRVVFIFKGSV